MPLVLTESSSFDSTVTVPQDDDVRNAASVQGPFQSLTDRTRYLYNKFGSSVVTYNSPLTVTRIINLNAATAVSGWAPIGANEWQASAGSSSILIPLDLYLQDGATLTSVVAYVTPFSATAMTLDVYRRTAGTSPTSSDLLAAYANSSGTSAQAVTMTPSQNNTVDKSTYCYTLLISSGASGDQLLSAKLVMTVPGLAP